MAKLPKLTGKELAAIVERLGFKLYSQVGSHMTYKHTDGRRTTIPYHAGEELGSGLLGKIIKEELNPSREEFMRLVKK